MRNGIIGIIAFVLCFGSLIAFNDHQNRIPVDVLKNVKLEYEGIHGAATAKVYNTIGYEGDDQKIKSFLNNNLTDCLSKNENLANEDTVTISMKYNSSKANAFKLNLKDTAKEIKVSGINSQFKSASQISTDLKDELKIDSSYAVRNVISQYKARQIIISIRMVVRHS